MQKRDEILSVEIEEPGVKLRSLYENDMILSHITTKASADLASEPNELRNLCDCPHWGFVIRGTVLLKYRDGSEEQVNDGQLFFWPPGHSVRFKAETEYIEFSPRNEMSQLLAHAKADKV